jgi:hypothetical protein
VPHFSPILREVGPPKMWRANEPGSEDQDLRSRKDIINQNPTSTKTREKWGTLSFIY